MFGSLLDQAFLGRLSDDQGSCSDHNMQQEELRPEDNSDLEGFYSWTSVGVGLINEDDGSGRKMA
jgi:hypothetical protein